MNSPANESVTSSDPCLCDAFIVKPTTRSFGRLIPRRRSGDYCLPLTLDRKLSIANEFRIGDALLEKFGLEEYVGGSNAEPPSRAIPEVFRATEVAPLTDLITPNLPELMRWLLPKVRAPWQAYNDVSRLGAPFYRPYDDKVWILKKLCPSIWRRILAYWMGTLFR